MLSQEDILYEDSWIIAINKPSGQFTQAALGVPNLQVALANYLQVRDSSPTVPFVGIIHRLDRPTSGVLVYGRNASAVRQMNEQFRERVTLKTYNALVSGVPERTGTAEDWMRKITDVAKAEICSESESEAKHAKLHWQRIAHSDTHALLSVTLETGRMHQIRLQLAARGHPIVGDKLYGFVGDVTKLNVDEEQASENQGASMLFGLHAAELTFRHPKTAKQMILKAPTPDAWKESFPWIES